VFDWDDLRYLLAVSRAGSFAGAARELSVKHTTVARRIAALEEALGAALVRKGTDHVALTRAGEEVMATAARMATEAESIARRVSGDGRIEGIVRVTMPDAFAMYVAKRVPELRDRHPDLAVHILSDARVYDLDAGEADIAIRVHAATKPHYIERKLCEPRWAFYASRDYVDRRGAPTNVAELGTHVLIGYGAEGANAPGAVWLDEHLPSATYEARFNSVVQVLNAIAMGLGVGPIPCFLGDGDSDLLRVCDVQLPARAIRLVAHPDVARVPRVRAVIDFIAESFKRDEAMWAGKRPHHQA
jgi:DNA-binding transcriptional LysR family regulator